MIRVRIFKYALAAALMLACTATFTSCGSDDDNSSTVIGTGTSGGGSTTTKILTSVKVRYQASPVDAASIASVIKDDHIYIRYVGSNGSIQQEQVTISDFTFDKSVELAVADSTYFGLQVIGVGKDSTEIAALTSTLNLNVNVTATVERVYSDNSTQTDNIKWGSYIAGMNNKYDGFENTDYDMSNSTSNKYITNRRSFFLRYYGGMVLNCFQAMVGKSDDYSTISRNKICRFWGHNKFTAQ